ncbi:membrane protein insertase YidC [Desulfobulbus alkaliphilus]|uniref:membrane protein insertase YidC n=1 Tax=Desulfobulbus alkaliphilus TaxID=869814 RepID=UPI001962ECDB|nr:membrane protein insertase YidC [Desulfobulbus alkaliphilus]MBM9537229.1 membrane protein insertase YidC [Desulfobulbus alkaliphilus]
MDLYRAFLAIILSFLILVGYQYFFYRPAPPQEAPQTATIQQEEVSTGIQALPDPATSPIDRPESVPIDREARAISVDTPLFTAVLHEHGGGFKSFVLNEFRTGIELDSGPMQLFLPRQPPDLPVLFSLDNDGGTSIPVYRAEETALVLHSHQEEGKLVMTAELAEGIRIVRTMTFHGDSYLISVEHAVENITDTALQISPALSLRNEPFAHASPTSKFLFAGPAAFVNGELEEIKTKRLHEGPVIFQGQVSWTGYVDNYFMTSVIPPANEMHLVTVQGAGGQVRTLISEGIRVLPAGASQVYTYKLYFGPKKLEVLKEIDNSLNSNLAKSVNFGWFDFIAKPMLWLLNFFYQYAGNYGVAIILLTVLIKLVFWPLSQKGMKSMKNMQKLQPKVAKLREKFKGDPTKMNQEMMALYKTYKVNPLGGCLPMLLQLPFFFALYKVLLAAIELRHAPFMLWINDLSAPDRLWVGFDIPYLHGLPILTLLMGASMYFQMKMTPTTADPMQARIMQFLPVVFTILFVNFASGLVLYWFINNLLSILQQQLINRQSKA